MIRSKTALVEDNSTKVAKRERENIGVYSL
jgi:hypothetical protein